jgi:hypothetical protein
LSTSPIEIANAATLGRKARRNLRNRSRYSDKTDGISCKSDKKKDTSPPARAAPIASEPLLRRPPLGCRRCLQRKISARTRLRWTLLGGDAVGASDRAKGPGARCQHSHPRGFRQEGPVRFWSYHSLCFAGLRRFNSDWELRGNMLDALQGICGA